LQPNHEQVNVRLGMAYLAAERGQDAYKALLLVKRLYPRNWAALVGLAVLHARTKELDAAKALLEDALALGGDEARALAGELPVLQDLLGQSAPAGLRPDDRSALARGRRRRRLRPRFEGREARV